MSTHAESVTFGNDADLHQDIDLLAIFDELGEGRLAPALTLEKSHQSVLSDVAADAALAALLGFGAGELASDAVLLTKIASSLMHGPGHSADPSVILPTSTDG